MELWELKIMKWCGRKMEFFSGKNKDTAHQPENNTISRIITFASTNQELFSDSRGRSVSWRAWRRYKKKIEFFGGQMVSDFSFKSLIDNYYYK